jgi:hypothetical protein
MNSITGKIWKYQELESSRPGYPGWKSYTVRDTETNVHIATVGNIDRYFEKNTEDHARLLAAAPELLDALRSALFFVPEGTKTRTEANIAIDKAMGYLNQEAE